ncbi:MAG: hypothetical protein ACPKMZ_05370 [Pleomorphochaeta sp.]
MVYGIETFLQYFKDYKDQYVLIGGSACDIVMQEYDIDFRTTKDLDIVLIIEMLNKSFVEKFWQFVKDGQYKNIVTNTSDNQFYRFSKPATPKFPSMMELFSRKKIDIELNCNNGLSPIHIDDNIQSLSAILLDDDYYNLLLSGKKETDNLSYLSKEMIILFKIKAYIDLKERKEKGESVDSRDIRKHRNDIFKLLILINPNIRIEIPPSIKKDLEKFLEIIPNDKPDLSALKIKGASFEDFIIILKDIYF